MAKGAKSAFFKIFMRFYGEKYDFCPFVAHCSKMAQIYIFNLKKLIKTQENYLTIIRRYIIIYKHCDLRCVQRFRAFSSVG